MAEDTKVEALPGEKLDAIAEHIKGVHSKVDSLMSAHEEHGKRLDALHTAVDSLHKRVDALEGDGEDEAERREREEEDRDEERLDARRREDARTRRDAREREDATRRDAREREDAAKHDVSEPEEDRRAREDARKKEDAAIRARRDAEDRNAEEEFEREDARRREDAQARRDARRPDESKERRDARHTREDARYRERADARRRRDADSEAKRSRDAEEGRRWDERAREDALREADSASLRRELEKLKAQMPLALAALSETDRAAFAAAQLRADAAYSAWSQPAPHALNGETVDAYRVRLLDGLKQHSKAFKATDLGKLVRADAAAFDEIERQVIADAIAASSRSSRAGAPLQKFVKRLESGHVETRFRGDSMDCWAPFTGGYAMFGKLNQTLIDRALSGR